LRGSEAVKKPGFIAMDGVTGLKALGVKDLNYRLVFVANHVEKSEDRFDLQHQQMLREGQEDEFEDVEKKLKNSFSEQEL
jgi:DNA replication licensing factor MCM6